MAICFAGCTPSGYLGFGFALDVGLVDFFYPACTSAWSSVHFSSVPSLVWFFLMSSSPPPVLILGHSFVLRLSSDLRSCFDAHTAEHFKLVGDAVIHLHGVGGRTVKKLRQHNLDAVSALKPDIILEIGTNDLVVNCPEVVGSEIDDLVQLLLDAYSVHVIGVCKVIPCVRASFFNAAAPILNQYLNGVLELCPTFFPASFRF